MAVIEVAELRPLVTTPLGDADLAQVISRVEADLTAVLGAAYDGNAISETLAGGETNIFTKRKIGSVSTLTDYASLSDVTGTVLSAGSDFYVWPQQGRIERLNGGTFGSRVVVSYVPEDDKAKWQSAVIDLVRLFLARSPLKSEFVVGSHSYQSPENWEAEVRRVARRLQFKVV